MLQFMIGHSRSVISSAPQAVMKTARLDIVMAATRFPLAAAPGCDAVDASTTGAAAEPLPL